MAHKPDMKAYMFPGQGSQFPEMGNDLYEAHPTARTLFEQANDTLGFDIARIMFEGTAEELKKTAITQPAIFIHSTIAALHADPLFAPSMVAGHSLGEFSALTACKALSFEEGLTLVSKRAQAMQHACTVNPSSMAAIIGLPDEVVEEICASLDETVVPANYNAPGQLVISGSVKGVEQACEQCKKAGARRALILQVMGAFHSPLMEPACEALNAAIDTASFTTPICPVYQNVDARPHTDIEAIKNNLKAQLMAPVLWTESIQNMIDDGATSFAECEPGKVLSGILKKIAPNMV